jgi:glyoxylase-like metal-dependent hydrolase (beta-lactamase superfamily II)
MTKINLGRPGLSVLPLGVGDAFSVVHHPTSMLVSRYQTPAWDDELVLIDVPQSIRRMMREADDGRFHGLDLHRVHTLILTHLHADHASGLETIAAFFKIAVGRKLRLVALPEVLEGVPDFLKTLESLGTIDDFFDVVPVTEKDKIELFPPMGGFNDGMTLRVRKTQHPIPTSALRIWDQGRQLAYSCDTAFDDRLWSWLWNGPRRGTSAMADLVIHEVGHGIHTNYANLVNALSADALRAFLEPKDRLRLIHYPDDMLPMLEATNLKLMREGKLEIV